jgi:hypothetical protein
MQMGGPEVDGMCIETCDFWCSTNWRIETPESGCETWVYDTREPTEGEDDLCQ